MDIRGLKDRIRRFFANLGPGQVEIAAGVLALVGGAWIFLAIASSLSEQDTRAFDHWLLQRLREVGPGQALLGPSWFEGIVLDLTALGGTAILTLVTLVVVAFLLLRKLWGNALIVAVAIGGGAILMKALKVFFDRARPDVVPHLATVTSESFPSGHSTLSAVVYVTLGILIADTVKERRTKVFCIVVALVLTGIVGCTRVLLGVHYPTDVLAGWSLGLTWALVCWFTSRFIARRGAKEAETMVVHEEEVDERDDHRGSWKIATNE